MLHEIGAFEAKNKFGTLLDWVGRGDEVVIMRKGKVAARMIRETHAFDREEARAAIKGLLEAGKGLSLGGLKIKDLINEGRL